MFTSTGRVEYRDDYSMVLLVDEGLVAYYRSFIPKSLRFNKPRYPAHITIVRTGEVIPDLTHWGEHIDQAVRFEYEGYIHIEEPYIWLSAFCKQLESFRAELGLDACFDKFKWFHITIANTK